MFLPCILCSSVNCFEYVFLITMSFEILKEIKHQFFRIHKNIKIGTKLSPKYEKAKFSMFTHAECQMACRPLYVFLKGLTMCWRFVSVFPSLKLRSPWYQFQEQFQFKKRQSIHFQKCFFILIHNVMMIYISLFSSSY